MNTITNKEISLGRSALIAGLGLLIMVFAAPVSEFYIFQKLISEDPAETSSNIINHKGLFTTGIFLHLLTLISDVVVAWALYIFLKPVHKSLSLLTAWFRLIYTAMYLIALINLIKVLNYVALNEQANMIMPTQLDQSISLFVSAFRMEWSFALMVFGIYLILLGYLVFKADYVPKIYGILLLLAGLGYFLDTLRAFFLPDLNTSYLMFTFFGELVFMVWLLVKGVKVKEKTEVSTPK
ncbi:hypothetical protein OKW21_003954 [Catalinimonas alkaloidigena]|uniref:DUF4386 domain-containing protein n=1 Tax=Catalinimonas alkaloidigena TaxID=1075417 RepID=UPI0024065B12|nr:DUF4386 domain-containing protein [Catalinimonas alkaloidigena]MDF9798691.1 hypothetical protein [Catalinimonas alkaloidigena]